MPNTLTVKQSLEKYFSARSEVEKLVATVAKVRGYTPRELQDELFRYGLSTFETQDILKYY